MNLKEAVEHSRRRAARRVSDNGTVFKAILGEEGSPQGYKTREDGNVLVCEPCELEGYEDWTPVRNLHETSGD